MKILSNLDTNKELFLLSFMMTEMCYLHVTWEGYFKISFMVVEVDNLDANLEIIMYFL